jgi:tetratricopeptide (TPR) repeat protein
VTAQLSDTSNGRQLWGDAYDRDLTTGDLFELQDELTQQVVWAIAGSYGALSRAALVESRRKAPSNLDAYDCVLRTYEYLQVHNAANHLAARDCLELAVELDPDYADAWAWLAYTFAEEHRHQWNARPKSYAALDRALEVAEHAVELDRTNQVAYGVLALTYFGRREFDRFGAEAERAVALNPNNAIWLAMLGTYFAQLGDWERGLPMMQKALTLTPNPPGWFYIPFFLDHYRQRRYEAALAAARKIALEDYYRTHLFLAAAYGQLGRLEEATRELGELRARRPDFSARVGEDLFQHYGYPAELTEHLLEGLRKAGLEENRT